MGMYGQQVMDSTKGRGTGDVLSRLRSASERMRQTQSDFGSAGRDTVGMDPRAQAEGMQQYGIDDATRRQEASVNAFDLANKQDTRNTQLNNEIQQLVDTQQTSVRGAEQQQKNLMIETDLFRKQSTNDMQEKLKQLDWDAYKSKTTREDTFRTAIRQGKEADYFLDKTINQEWKMQDLDMWYQTLMNQVDNDFKDWEFKSKAEQDATLKKYQSQGQNMSTTINGLVSIANAGAQYYSKYMEGKS